MADSSKIQVGYMEETAFGTTPGTPAWQLVPLTDESLGQDPSFVEDPTIIATRDVADIIRTGLSAGGGINYVLRPGKGIDGGSSVVYGFPDDFYVAGMQQADFEAKVATAVTTLGFQSITTAGGGYAKITAAAGLDVFTVGSIIYIIDGGADTDNDKLYARVVSKAATALEVTVLNGTNDLVDKAGNGSEQVIQASYVRNGITALRTYSIRKKFQDLTTADSEELQGMAVQSFGFGINARSILTGSFGFIGKNASSGETASSTTVAHTTADAFNATHNVLAVCEGADTDLAKYSCLGLTIECRNALRARDEVGVLGAESIGSGTFSASGTLRARYKSVAQMNRYLNASQTGLAFVMDSGGLSSPSGTGLVLDFPAARFERGRRVAGGRDQDIIADMSWRAFRDPTLGYMCQISRFGVS